MASEITEKIFGREIMKKKTETRMTANVLKQDPNTHKRFKGKLFIRTKTQSADCVFSLINSVLLSLLQKNAIY